MCMSISGCPANNCVTNCTLHLARRYFKAVSKLWSRGDLCISLLCNPASTHEHLFMDLGLHFAASSFKSAPVSMGGARISCQLAASASLWPGYNPCFHCVSNLSLPFLFHAYLFSFVKCNFAGPTFFFVSVCSRLQCHFLNSWAALAYCRSLHFSIHCSILCQLLFCPQISAGVPLALWSKRHETSRN